MSIIDTLITDRTAPGRYDWRDFNRVEEAVAYISAELEGLGYSAPVSVKTDWARGDKLSRADADRYVKNVQTLRAVLTVFKDTPAAPESIRFLTYGRANDLEKILVDVEVAIRSMQEIFVHCNQPLVFCGSVIYAAT